MYAVDYARVDISGSSSFERNFADESGGGIYAEAHATVSIDGYSGFINNSAKEFGGGLYVIDASRINISGNSCFTGNSAKLGGGGMYVVKKYYSELQWRQSALRKLVSVWRLLFNTRFKET